MSCGLSEELQVSKWKRLPRPSADFSVSGIEMLDYSVLYWSIPLADEAKAHGVIVCGPLAATDDSNIEETATPNL